MPNENVTHNHDFNITKEMVEFNTKQDQVCKTLERVADKLEKLVEHEIMFRTEMKQMVTDVRDLTESVSGLLQNGLSEKIAKKIKGELDMQFRILYVIVGTGLLGIISNVVAALMK